MRFELSQQARLGQQLKLAPRVLQSMEILQLPLAEMEERIEAELESNVALEQVETGDDAMPEGDRTDPAQQLPGTASPAPMGAERFERAAEFNDRMGDDEAGDLWREAARREGEFDPRAAALESAPSPSESLEDVLVEQWMLCEAPTPLLEAGKVLISFIGDNGFLTRSLEEIAAAVAEDPDAPSLELLEKALPRLQAHLDPPGIGARDLRESLMIQLNAKERAATDAHQNGEAHTRIADAKLLVEHDLHDLGVHRHAAIRARHGWTTQRLDGARECLRHCDPAPGRSLHVESAEIVRPDVVIEYDQASDSYSARLASGVLPNLRVSEEYSSLLKAKRTDQATKDLLTDSIRRARWFIDAIEQRGATLLRVVNEVIAHQREWLDTGGGGLRKLPMSQVADALKVNVSTVSRTVAGKWISTPRGAFELRRLFSGGTETESGSDISWVAVKGIVGEIIAGEDKTKPLSDQEIVHALDERGIPLARRTVVKYREQLGYPAARARRMGDAS